MRRSSERFVISSQTPWSHRPNLNPSPRSCDNGIAELPRGNGVNLSIDCGELLS